MKNKSTISRKNSLVRLIALILFGTIVFTFLHSELGFLDYDGNNHGTHDYCEIVKNINTHTKTVRDELPKLELTKILCHHCSHAEETIISIVIYDKTDQHTIVKHSTETYLFNRAFLI